MSSKMFVVCTVPIDTLKSKHEVHFFFEPIFSEHLLKSKYCAKFRSHTHNYKTIMSKIKYDHKNL